MIETAILGGWRLIVFFHHLNIKSVSDYSHNVKLLIDVLQAVGSRVGHGYSPFLVNARYIEPCELRIAVRRTAGTPLRWLALSHHPPHTPATTPPSDASPT